MVRALFSSTARSIESIAKGSSKRSIPERIDISRIESR